VDAFEQLRRLQEAGFALERFDRYPGHIGAIREECIALLEFTPAGLHLTGEPGWRMGEVMGVLVEKDGRKVFQAKSELLEASSERLEVLRRFREDLGQLLLSVV
jgi:hypothetical protein